MQALTGYGPSRGNGSRWSRLLSDGDKEKYEIWETKFFDYLRSFGLKNAFLDINLTGDKGDDERKKEASTELVQFLDDKSFPLIIRETAENGKKPSTHYTDATQEKENRELSCCTSN